MTEGESQLRAYPWSRFSLPLCADSLDRIYPNIPAKWSGPDKEPNKPYEMVAYKSDLGGYFDFDDEQTNAAESNPAGATLTKRKRRDVVRLVMDTNKFLIIKIIYTFHF